MLKHELKWRFVLACVALTLCVAPAFAGWTDSLKDGLASGWDSLTGLFSGSDEPKTPNNEDDSMPGYLSGGWNKLTATLSEALDLRDEGEKLPESAWFGSDKSSNAKKINRLLDDALEILSQGRAGEMRRDAAALRERQSSLRAEADRLRNQRISAPEGSILPWRKTRADIDRRLSELDAELKDIEASISAMNAELAGELDKMGLKLDQSQIDVLLSSVTGDDLLQNAVVFSNVKAVVEKLEALSRSDANDLEICRRYTGMYLVLNDLLIYAQESLVGKIEGDYKPRLAAMLKESEEIRADALKKSRQKDYTEAQRQSFERNAEANAMTAKVANLYSELLEGQRKGLLQSIQELRRSRDLAENTYRTVRSSGDLRNLIRSGLSLFDSIEALSMPQLQPFESETMRLEFEEINRRLKR